MRLVAGPVLIVLVVGLAAGCGGKKQSTTTTAAAGATFESVPWILASGIDVPGWQQTAPSAEFVDGTMGGSNGCNHFTADYTVDGDSLAIGTIASTRMACPPPGSLVEHAYVEALGNVTGWQSDGTKLTLVGQDGAALLTYDAASPVGNWEATAIQTGTALQSTHTAGVITAKFGSDGSLTGSADCNSYSTTYTTERGGIAINLPTSTRVACGGPDGALADAYLAVIPTATHYRVDGGMLSLLRADGTLAAAYTRKP